MLRGKRLLPGDLKGKLLLLGDLKGKVSEKAVLKRGSLTCRLEGKGFRRKWF